MTLREVTVVEKKGQTNLNETEDSTVEPSESATYGKKIQNTRAEASVTKSHAVWMTFVVALLLVFLDVSSNSIATFESMPALQLPEMPVNLQNAADAKTAANWRYEANFLAGIPVIES
jgi:hypothetical protein